MERTASPVLKTPAADRDGNLAAAADYLKGIDRRNRDVWAASTVAAYDKAIEVASHVPDADVVTDGFVRGARYVHLERVTGPAGGRKCLVFALTGTGREFIATYGRGRAPLMGERAIVAEQVAA